MLLLHRKNYFFRRKMTPTTNHSNLKNWGLLVLLALIWGSSFILIKRGLEVFSPGEVGAYRIVAAATFLLPLSLPRIKFLTSEQAQNLILIGLLGSFIPAFLFPTAQTRLSSSLTGVLNALTPLFVVIIAGLCCVSPHCDHTVGPGPGFIPFRFSVA